MAVVLGHGLEPAHPVAMYSFFNTGSHETLQKGQANNSSCGLDGTNELSSDNPFTRSRISSRSVKEPQTVQTSHLKTQEPYSPVRQPVNDTSSIDVDPTSSRRKRRKVTPDEAPQNLIVGQSGTSRANRPIQTTDHAQHIIPVEENVQIQSSHISTSNQEQEASLTSPPDAALQTPKKRTPRKVQVKTGTEISGNASHQPDTDHTSDLTPSKTKRSTPKKKTIALHTNGKLLSSPATDSLPLKDAKMRDGQKTSSNRNFKMKNGKFVQSFEVVLRYGQDQRSREDTGRKIDALLERSNGITQSDDGQGYPKTHPFFLGKVKSKTQAGEQNSGQGDNTDNDTDPTSRQREPVAWKDIKFSTQKPVFFKSVELARPIWPPLFTQNVGKQFPNHYQHGFAGPNSVKAKLKSRTVHLIDEENILSQYALKLGATPVSTSSIIAPQKQHLSGTQVAQHLDSIVATSHPHDAILSARSRLISGTSAFDRGECAGPNAWTSHFAPTCVSEVLQPSALTLRRWLQSLAIHNVKSGIDTNGNLKKPKNQTKKKRRKPKDGIDDFVVNSDDEQDESKITKTAILITGPHGCGKTASVYAVAKELGFEVFEIHPGMRRSAKDIFDKVGDMAHNHLVQNGPELSRSSSVAPSESDTFPDAERDRKQTSIIGSLAARATVNTKPCDQQVLPRAKKEQKQSLILFEEADLLFDDDRGFWSGVQSLIMHSKRPVVLTCNDLSSIPLEDLNLYDVLEYESIEQEIATDYLAYLTAAEGHVIDREALSSLYMSKNKDLRATITELNLWCQMTVGSKQGGLDWMDQSLPNQGQTDNYGGQVRIFSHNTFQKSLDLVPQINIDGEDAIRFDQDVLDLDASNWCDLADAATYSFADDGYTNLEALSRVSDIIEARSVIDLLDDFAAPVLSHIAAGFNQTQHLASDRAAITSRHMKKLVKDVSHRQKLFEALEPIMNEKPTFPPSLGRLAPSIDAARSSVMTEVAPYVRCIVNFDRRLEEQRDELFGSQGKTRKTRAARAAAEGGDKASTRSERWFPKDLDFDKVMHTGGLWPEWYDLVQG